MSITLNLPIVVDVELLRVGMETAARCGTDLKIGTFFRLNVNGRIVDCDKED
jgi:hypothetical protein